MKSSILYSHERPRCLISVLSFICGVHLQKGIYLEKHLSGNEKIDV